MTYKPEYISPSVFRTINIAVLVQTQEAGSAYRGISEILPYNHPAVIEARQDFIDYSKALRKLAREKHNRHENGMSCGVGECKKTPDDPQEWDALISKVNTELRDLNDIQEEARAKVMNMDEALGMALGVAAKTLGTDVINLL